VEKRESGSVSLPGQIMCKKIRHQFPGNEKRRSNLWAIAGLGISPARPSGAEWIFDDRRSNAGALPVKSRSKRAEAGNSW
jgi:hypothetical protein